MENLEPVGVVVRLIVAIVLVTSSVAKLRSPSDFMTVLRALGLRRLRFWWLAVCCAELAVVAAVVVPLNPMAAAAAIALLGVMFAAAGAKGAVSGRVIRCACFGSGGSWRLGWHQVAALPLWLVAAAAVTLWQPAVPYERAALLATVLVLPLLVTLAQLWSEIYRSRSNRLAFAEAKRVSAPDTPTDSRSVAEGSTV